MEANGVEKDGITRNKEEAVNDNLPTAFHIDHKGNYLLLKIKSLLNQIFQRFSFRIVVLSWYLVALVMANITLTSFIWIKLVTGKS